MSHIASSRMPHAYAAPEPDTADTQDKAANDLAAARAAIGKVPVGAWIAGAIGAGAAGAALYAAFTAKPRKKTASRAKPKRQRAKAA
ncbi:hypothetical protein [Sphingomonas sp.]|uniref:hypothetical protein n=1 Tax=Sphingomonas sp. TaxID=28214 RepID=UPI003B3AD758